ncbi:MAG: YgiT-type zinc finger protein [Armatimonadetes bacterium]|nr:YgiT-type zinc finger protein [Armatimonadota bacterium]
MPEKTTALCLVCGEALTAATGTLTLERNGIAVCFAEVPCLRCPTCGEEEYAGPTAVALGKVAERIFETGDTMASLPAPVRHVSVDFPPQKASVTA